MIFLQMYDFLQMYVSYKCMFFYKGMVLIVFVPIPYFSLLNSQSMHITYVMKHNSIAMFSPKNVTPLAGFELGSSVRKTDMMTWANKFVFVHILYKRA
jgi:hypothetical protein